MRPGGSDSATFDNVLELLVLAGRSLPHAVMMMVPEAWEERDDLPEHLRAFYAFHSCVMEPWDGPAAICFTDGRVIGATLDRNGLRPGRWMETRDGWVVLASESGVLDEPPGNILRKGRLAPGKLFLVDLAEGRIVADEEVKERVATAKPYGEWYGAGVVRLEDLPQRQSREHHEPLRTRQLAFGYTQEDLRVLLAPMAAKGEEPIGSMGNDLALAVLSDQAPPLFSYFKQLFAQVTNPPIDPIRESVVMSIRTGVGSESNLLTEGPDHAHQLDDPAPDPAQLRARGAARRRLLRVPLAHDPDHLARRRRARGHDVGGAADLRAGGRGDRLRRERARAVRSRDRPRARRDPVAARGRRRAPPPRARGHAPAGRPGARVGRAARGPPLRDADRLRRLGDQPVPDARVAHGGRRAGGAVEQAERNVVKAIGKGLLKTLSKMGISTIQSYNGAQIFEAVGLASDMVERHFTGTASRIGGIGLDVLARETLARHLRAYPEASELLPVGGIYAWRRDGEHHQWNPEAIAKLQHAVRHGGQAGLRRVGRRDERVLDARRASLRGLIGLRFAAGGGVPLDEVEPASEIVKRFATGAMSLGSLSREAHETLAIAMNRLGGRSNTGEGGEDAARYVPDPNGDSRRSAIKQVASGRFGVTVHYLTNADEIQIKMAQGAKPGEGGQLPGHKVDGYIGRIRASTPGVGLISPPPHHDIYSIEDLKQLIYDLRCANPAARISVKLVAEVGVGTVAAGVAKANADHILISGHDGGTGASPLSSLQSAGVPWEIGLAETQQTLVLNDLRSRVWVQADGQMKTGRDVVIAALLGADEVGFSTAPLIAAGCIMMRACHLNTCPVGIATQDPELRKRFEGTPEHVVNYLFFVAEEARELMARLGVRRYEDLVGRTELLEAAPGGRPLEGARHRPLARAGPARGAAGRAAPARAPAGLAAAGRAGLGADRGRARRDRPPPPGHRAVRRCATSTAPSAGCSRTGSPRSTAPPGCRRRRSASTCAARPGSRSARGWRRASSCRWSATRTTTAARGCRAA